MRKSEFHDLQHQSQSQFMFLGASDVEVIGQCNFLITGVRLKPTGRLKLCRLYNTNSSDKYYIQTHFNTKLVVSVCRFVDTNDRYNILKTARRKYLRSGT